MLDQIKHDVVARGDRLRDWRDLVSDEVLGVVEPNVCAMRKAGYPQKLGESRWMCVFEHLAREARVEFRNAVGGDW